jgi:hypothetical protein
MLKLWDFLDSRVTNSFITPQTVEQLGVKTELVTNPIMVQLAQGIAKPLLNVMLSVELFCDKVRFFENFILCDLNNFDAIFKNTFLDVYKVYKVDILYNRVN